MEMEAKEEQRENEVIPSSDESRSVSDDHDHLVLSGVWIGLISGAPAVVSLQLSICFSMFPSLFFFLLQRIWVSLVRDGYGYVLRVAMKDGSTRAQKAWFGVTKL
ncbi:hypothetical protein RHGRI_007285 [Rhododendron griersonianum]|uniref:Transmembrane protein n=1 Tax=Rhododendron griersonianum TaxID=479676 RepID=A0AAV6KX26_9ERIC|nr:hypothetical protein RHGRI_007285 [Rhododendron griersonianum]